MFDASIHCAAANHQHGEFLHQGFGQWVIWSASSDYVMWLLSSQKNRLMQFSLIIITEIFNFSLPYKSHPPFGYLIVWLIEFVSNLGLPLSLVPLMCHTIGVCWLIISFIKDLTNDFSNWNGVDNHLNAQEFKARLRNTVQLHSNVKQLSKKCGFSNEQNENK